MTTYTITYEVEGKTVTRYITEMPYGLWQLLDDDHRNVRPFDTVAEAFLWVDEERKESTRSKVSGQSC